MKKGIKVIAVIAMALLFISANKFIQTSADPETSAVQIRFGNTDVPPMEVRLNSRGIVIKKYPNKTLRYLKIDIQDIIYVFQFYEGNPQEMEKLKSVQRFRNFGTGTLLHGKSEYFDEYGTLVAEKNWYKGFLDGAQKIFNKYGQLIDEKYYYEGFPIGCWKKFSYKGEKVYEITFPKDKTEWKQSASNVMNKKEEKSSFINATYVTPIKVVEAWFDKGAKVKENELLAYKEKSRFVIKPCVKSTYYEADGKITMTKEKLGKYGTQIEKGHFQSFNVQYNYEKSWLDGKIFKSSSWTLPINYTD